MPLFYPREERCGLSVTHGYLSMAVFYSHLQKPLLQMSSSSPPMELIDPGH